MNARVKNRRKHERGVTLPLMVFGMVLVLGMAALAIDVATLYLAKSEAQRAANAAALAAARAFILASTTTDPGGATAQTVANSFALQEATAAVAQNNIGGRPGQLVPSYPDLKFSVPATPSNPRATVIVQQTGLPTFFSRLWSRVPNSVRATAVAEGYNPSGFPSNPAVSVRCVKPFIVPNRDPAHPIGGGSFQTIIDPTTGDITNKGRITAIPPGIIGELIRFKADCPGGGCSNSNNKPQPAASSGSPPVLDFVAAILPSATSGVSCPSCAVGSTTQFEKDISCCNTAALACNSASGNPVTMDMSTNPGINGGPLSNGLQCLIHQAPLNGMDSLDPTGFPFQAGPFRFQAGPNNPLVLAPSPIVRTSDVLSTSDSLISLMIYDDTQPIPPNGAVSIIGYLQVFVVKDNNDGTLDDGSFDGYILNVVGCGNSAHPGSPVQGGGASPVAVRLMHPDS